MITANIPRRVTPQIRSEAATHLFTVGQTVRLKGAFGRLSQLVDIYHITRTLPPSGDLPQYRIRNDSELHERVTTQDNLEPMGASLNGDRTPLTERTFGNG